jgi:MoxR-like ATPase
MTDGAKQKETPAGLASVEAVTQMLAGTGYIATPEIATAVYLAHHLRKPVLIEGPAGVGKTDLARSVAIGLEQPLIRMQCYEGLDESKALYEWKYGKQLLYTQILKDKIGHLVEDADSLDEALHKLTGFQDIFFSRDFLEPRPLLEVLSDYQVTVPEIGTIAAQVPPLVVLTSNATRELGDALKRRCLHLHIDFPNADLEAQIVRTRVPEVTERLLERLVDFVQAVRGENIRKLPSISETIDWARTLILLHADSLDPALVRSTLNVILKRQSDIAEVAGKVEALLSGGDKASR